MTPSGRRVGVLAAVFAAVLAAVLVHLWVLMVEQHESWLLRSFRNRWSFRDVPTHRGTIEDRHGRVLVRDEPGFQLDVVYAEFRRFHPVGAAVHGATLRLEATPGLAQARFSYAPGPRGPEPALRTLLGMPVQSLRPGVLPRETARNLQFYAVSVLAALTGRSRGSLYRELRQAMAAEHSGPVGLGDALPGIDGDAVLAAFRDALQRLDQLDAMMVDRGSTRPWRDRLDELRRGWLDDPTEREREYWRRPLYGSLDFAQAASVGVAADQLPGFVLDSAVERVRLPGREGDSALALLLGAVGDMDRDDLDRRVFEQRLGRALAEEDLEVLVPDAAVPSPELGEWFRQAAHDRMAAVLRRRERQGTSGIERTQDARLSGLPGLRLVEQDKSARERLLWSALQVAPGRDLRLTVDLDLQELVEREALAFHRSWATHPAVDPDRLDVGVALIDARSGDVLALGGAPLRLGPDRQLRGQPPGLGWLSSGDLGSVSKPFLVLEQLAAERGGAPCRPHLEFGPCTGDYRRVGQQRLSCMHAHGDAGRDPSHALSESCNIWFFQAAEGLGADGVLRALARFGLANPQQLVQPGGLAASWQPRPRELPSAMAPQPRVGGNHLLQRRAIGYGVEAASLHVARAYAGLATGVLPTLGFLLGEARDRVALGVPAADLAVVHQGLRECVLHGTAAKVPGLARFQVLGKTGTAEITRAGDNNAWFAGWLPFLGQDGVQLAFCTVVYHVPHGSYGAEVAGQLLEHVLAAMARSPELTARYLRPESGR